MHDEDTKPGRLGAIFANATASVGKYPWLAQAEAKPKQVLVCATCAAPQEKERVFHCDHCGGDLFVEKGKDDDR